MTFSSLEIEPIKEIHLSKVIDIWLSQYKESIASGSLVSQSWLTNISLLRNFITNHINEKKGVVARSGDAIVGYFLFDSFMFHGENTAFSPIIGHGALSSYKVLSYQAMYQYLSTEWIEQGILNHLLTFFSYDRLLKDFLYELGFGLYGVDAFRSTDPILLSDGNLTILEADMNLIADLIRLEEDCRLFFKQAPLFLVSNPHSLDYYKNVFENEGKTIFLAKIHDEVVGFITISKNDDEDMMTLADKSTGMITGTFVQPEHRSSGIGTYLLQRCVEWSQKMGLDRIHVDFESANLFGYRFWLKHFTPALYSVNRKINHDIIKV